MMRLRWLIALTLLHAAPAAATTYTVTNTNDSGPGSLRECITVVNANPPGPHRIAFNILSPGVQTIHLLSSLDDINVSVALDGTSQPGYNVNVPAPLIEIDGTGATSGVRTFAPNSSFKGIVFNRFPNSALGVYANACTVSACYVGTNATGTAKSANGLVGVSASGNDIVIGGRIPSQRNIISGNTIGVQFSNTSDRDTVMNNYIGTDVNGTTAIGNGQYGVATAGAISLIVDSNVISGNGFDGIYVGGSVPDSASGVRIYRNLIGTDASGRNKIANHGSGVRLLSWFTTVGGIGRGNVISGNDQWGVFVDGNFSSLNQILGNKIGVTADGSYPLGNGLDGVLIADSFGNTVGLSRGDGTGNLIAANGGYGVDLDGNNAVDNFVQGNAIGTNFNGSLALGNAMAGVATTGDRATIGGAGLQGNLIAYNHGGVYIGAVQDPIQGNSIFANGPGLGIDLLEAGPGVTPNDSLDGDDGSNHFQNFPVLTAVTQVGNKVRLQGRLASESNHPYTLDFYSNRNCSASGYGEGESWLGEAPVLTNDQGSTTFDLMFPLAGAVGYVFTCTATDDQSATPSTSEFSPCGALGATPTDAPPMKAQEYSLGPSRPSPARTFTSLTYSLPVASSVRLRAYDVSGRLVASLVDGEVASGWHAADWRLEGVRAGTYFCRFDARATDGSGRTFRAARPVIVVR